MAYVTSDAVLGVGTGNTVRHFIQTLQSESDWMRPQAAVATSLETKRSLKSAGIQVIDLEDIKQRLSIYVDGADEIDRLGRAIKGGGGAHVEEKRVARSSQAWICIIDESKLVEQLGTNAPIPLEVIPGLVANVLTAVTLMGGSATVRAAQVADSGNPLVDVSGLSLSNPLWTEDALEAIPGVIACGVFAHRRADVILVGRADGSVLTLKITAITPNICHPD